MSASQSSADSLIAEIMSHFLKQKVSAEQAMAQVDDVSFFAALGDDDNSIAVIAKHMAGNLRSRFADFLTTDGEKPDRNRDGEFEVDRVDSRVELMMQWERGWATLLETLRSLGTADLATIVRVRGEPATVQQALLRALVHQSQHAGQIVLLAKHFAGVGWQTLSIPRRASR